MVGVVSMWAGVQAFLFNHSFPGGFGGAHQPTLFDPTGPPTHPTPTTPTPFLQADPHPQQGLGAGTFPSGDCGMTFPYLYI